LKRNCSWLCISACTIPRKWPFPTTPTTLRDPLTALLRFSDHARYWQRKEKTFPQCTFTLINLCHTYIESNGCFSKKSWMRKAQHIINNAFCNFTHKGLNYICMSYHITFMDVRLQQGWKSMTHFLKHCRECIICPQSLLQNKIYLNPSTYKISKEKEHMIPTRHQTKTYANWQGQWARS
jgi:hypothetical protein